MYNQLLLNLQPPLHRGYKSHLLSTYYFDYVGWCPQFQWKPWLKIPHPPKGKLSLPHIFESRSTLEHAFRRTWKLRLPPLRASRHSVRYAARRTWHFDVLQHHHVVRILRRRESAPGGWGNLTLVFMDQIGTHTCSLPFEKIALLLSWKASAKLITKPSL